MPTLRELQKRLESAETIRQLSGAMRSAATAKYTKLAAALDAYSPYAAAMRDIAPGTNGDNTAASEAETNAPALCLLVSGNRGLCGGYHHQLFAFFSEFYASVGPRVVTCGKKALDFCRSKNIPVDADFALSDVPSFAEAKRIADFAFDLYSSGEVGGIVVCYQRFYNMLRAVPSAETLLRRSGSDTQTDCGDVIFIPAKSAVEQIAVPVVFAANVYDRLLSAQTAAQAATLVAMRSAYDNASASITSLEVRINRLRQAAVTASVLETATDVKEQL